MELRDQLAAIIHAADCGCDGEDIDPAYTTLADKILETPDMHEVEHHRTDDRGKRYTRFELRFPPIEHGDD